jgi:hypothetical protein
MRFRCYRSGVSRPRLGPVARTQSITVKLSPRDIEALDKARGSRPRSGFLRSLIPTDPTQPKPAEKTEPPVESPTVTFSNTSEGRHLHRFNREGKPLDYHLGRPVYLYRCECGAAKKDT